MVFEAIIQEWKKSPGKKTLLNMIYDDINF